MDRYQLRSKGELPLDQAPVSVATQTENQYNYTPSRLVQPVALIGPGTPPEGQAAAQPPAAASQDAVSPPHTDRTDAGLPHIQHLLGPRENDPLSLPATTAAGAITGTWTTTQGQGHSSITMPTVVVGPHGGFLHHSSLAEDQPALARPGGTTEPAHTATHTKLWIPTLVT